MQNHQNQDQKVNLSSQAKISDTPFNQSSLQHGKVVICNVTDTHTGGHGDCMTELAYWADSVREKNHLLESDITFHFIVFLF